MAEIIPQDLHKGYRGDALACLKRFQVSVWSDVEVVSTRGAFTGIILPRGEHVLEIVTETSSDRAVRVAGYMTSSVFSILGLASAVLLLGVYLHSKISGARTRVAEASG